MYSLMGLVAGVSENFGSFCSKDFSSGVTSFLERFITHLSWMLEEVEEVTAVWKVLAVLEVVVEDLHMRYLMWCYIYNRSFIPMFTPFKLQDN